MNASHGFHRKQGTLYQKGPLSVGSLMVEIKNEYCFGVMQKNTKNLALQWRSGPVWP